MYIYFIYLFIYVIINIIFSAYMCLDNHLIARYVATLFSQCNVFFERRQSTYWSL